MEVTKEIAELAEIGAEVKLAYYFTERTKHYRVEPAPKLDRILFELMKLKLELAIIRQK